jgi:hypothetical protein
MPKPAEEPTLGGFPHCREVNRQGKYFRQCFALHGPTGNEHFVAGWPSMRFRAPGHPGEATPAAEGHHQFRAISRVSWHTVNLRGAASSATGARDWFDRLRRTADALDALAYGIKARHPNIRTLSRLSPPFECSDVRLGWQEARKLVLELRRPVTVPREICSLGRMNDDRSDLESALTSRMCSIKTSGTPRRSSSRRISTADW